MCSLYLLADFICTSNVFAWEFGVFEDFEVFEKCLARCHL